MNDFSLKPIAAFANNQGAVILRRFIKKISNNQRLKTWNKKLSAYLEFKTKELWQKFQALSTFKQILFLTLAYLAISNKVTLNIGEDKQLKGNEMVKISSAALHSPTFEGNRTDLIPGPAQNFDYIFNILPTDDENTIAKKKYIKRFHKVARQEMKKFGIPASVKMAQALLESGAGGSKLAAQNNNHFGIKCFSNKCTKGHCSNFHDDHHKDFFRIYNTSWDSWRAHSRFLSSDRYNHLKKHKNDYKKWAFGLKEAGYATDKNYPNKLIKIIEDYNLYSLDI